MWVIWFAHLIGFLVLFTIVVLTLSRITNPVHMRFRTNRGLILGLSVLLIVFSIAEWYYAFNFGDSWEVRMTSARYRRFWPEYYGGLPVGLAAVLLSMTSVEQWTTRAFHYFWGLSVCLGAYVTDEMFLRVGGYRGPSTSASSLGWIGESTQAMLTVFPLMSPFILLSGIVWYCALFWRNGIRFITIPGFAFTIGIVFAFYSFMNWAGFMWD